MSRILHALIAAALLTGCGGQQFSLFSDDPDTLVVSHTRLVMCPRFEIESCLNDFPETIEGQRPAPAKLTYAQMKARLYTCSGRVEAFRKAQRRCADEAAALEAD